MGTSPLPACPPKGQEHLLASAWGREPLAEPPPVPWQQAGCGDTAGPINLEVGTPPAGNGGHQARGEGCSEQERGEQALVGARPRVAAHLSGPDRLPSFCLPS